MARYFFDSRDDDVVTLDEEGFEFDTFEEVKRQAAKTLALIAVDVLPGSLRRCLGIDVKNAAGDLVLVSELVFEARVLIEV